ncbi:MAG: hypothetical protein ABS910_01865 [Arthrobacter sp.]
MAGAVMQGVTRNPLADPGMAASTAPPGTRPCLLAALLICGPVLLGQAPSSVPPGLSEARRAGTRVGRRRLDCAVTS